jgi:hypothetical protein
MNNPPEAGEPAAAAAWLSSLTPDELETVYEPPGYKFMYIVVALTKRWLLAGGLKPAENLVLLERLHSLVDGHFTSEKLASIEPAGDLEEQIFKEAKSLDPPKIDRLPASFEILTSSRVFWHFCVLNPSLLAAVKKHPRFTSGAAA